MKIPTADDQIKDFITEEAYNKKQILLDIDEIAYLMIEFAKLHVEAALKAALINVDIDMNGVSKDQLPNPHFKVVEDSILNSYNLDNIK